jgi:hypothetical protein
MPDAANPATRDEVTMIQELSQRIAGNEVPVILLTVLFLVAYLMPALVAAIRRHRFTQAIAALNVLLGWTGLGWLAAMIWAVNRDVVEAEVQARPRDEREADFSLREPSWSDVALRLDDAEPVQAAKTVPCTHCEEPVEADALFCRHCGREVAAVPAAPAAATLDAGSLKEVYSVLSDADRDTAETELDRKLLDMIDYARALEQRAASGERSAVTSSVEKSGTEMPGPGFEIVRRTGTGSGG